MCTKLPGWGIEYNLEIGDSGYITLQTYLAGEFYYDRNADIQRKIKFSNVYFKDFIKDNKNCEKIIL